MDERKFHHSLADATRGIAAMVASQRNARIHLVISLLVVATGAWLGLPRGDWVVLVVTMMLVLSAEAMNTALESLADAAIPELHPRVGLAKDAAAGSVLICAAGAVVVGGLVLGPALWARLVQ